MVQLAILTIVVSTGIGFLGLLAARKTTALQNAAREKLLKRKSSIVVQSIHDADDRFQGKTTPNAMSMAAGGGQLNGEDIFAPVGNHSL